MKSGRQGTGVVTNLDHVATHGDAPLIPFKSNSTSDGGAERRALDALLPLLQWRRWMISPGTLPPPPLWFSNFTALYVEGEVFGDEARGKTDVAVISQ